MQRVSNDREHVLLLTPPRVKIRITLPLLRLPQRRIPPQVLHDHQQVTPVEPPAGAVTQTKPQPDQVVFESLREPLDEGQEARDSPTSTADSSSQRFIISMNSPWVSSST